MAFSWFKPNRQKIRNQLAEDMGYNNGWLGLHDGNPFAQGTPEYHAYNWGYNEAVDDIAEWADAHNPFDYSSDIAMFEDLARMQ